jgi:hypothetical protein
MDFDKTKFIDFLLTAKKETYAGDGKELIVENTGMKQLDYSFGKFYYRDTYSGYEHFIGQESVSFESQPIWEMVYVGGIENNQFEAEFIKEVYIFLKKAMSWVSEENPFRGPKEFKHNNWEYNCDYLGDVKKFSGTETIFFENKKIYSLVFFGGEFKK